MLSDSITTLPSLSNLTDTRVWHSTIAQASYASNMRLTHSPFPQQTSPQMVPGAQSNSPGFHQAARAWSQNLQTLAQHLHSQRLEQAQHCPCTTPALPPPCPKQKRCPWTLRHRLATNHHQQQVLHSSGAALLPNHQPRQQKPKGQILALPFHPRLPGEEDCLSTASTSTSSTSHQTEHRQREDCLPRGAPGS